MMIKAGQIYEVRSGPYYGLLRKPAEAVADSSEAPTKPRGMVRIASVGSQSVLGTAKVEEIPIQRVTFVDFHMRCLKLYSTTVEDVGSEVGSGNWSLV